MPKGQEKSNRKPTLVTQEKFLLGEKRRSVSVDLLERNLCSYFGVQLSSLRSVYWEAGRSKQTALHIKYIFARLWLSEKLICDNRR